MFNETARLKLREIGRTIRSYRKAVNLDQTALAEALGVSPITISRWERGATAIPATQWEALLHCVHRKGEPYPVPAHTQHAAEVKEEHITRTILAPELVAETKALREMLSVEVRTLRDALPAVVRDSIRAAMQDLNTVLPALTRDAVRDALRDSAPELRSIQTQLSPLAAELKLLKDQLVVAVKEELAARPVVQSAGRKWEKREHKDDVIDFNPESPEVKAILDPAYTADDADRIDMRECQEEVFSAADESGEPIGPDVDAYPVTKAAIYTGIKAGVSAVARGEPIDTAARSAFVEKATADLKRLGFKYATSKGTAALLACGFIYGTGHKERQDKKQAVKAEEDAARAKREADRLEWERQAPQRREAERVQAEKNKVLLNSNMLVFNDVEKRQKVLAHFNAWFARQGLKTEDIGKEQHHLESEVMSCFELRAKDPKPFCFEDHYDWVKDFIFDGSGDDWYGTELEKFENKGSQTRLDRAAEDEDDLL